MRFARPLAVAALAGAALLASPAQAVQDPPKACDVSPQVCFTIGDPFWLFRACGPLVACP
jgi:hypothetical protein